MNIHKLLLTSLLIIVTVLGIHATLNLPQKTIGNENFYYYKVGNNESVKDIANKLGVSTEDIIKFNPSASNGLSKNQLLFFPVSYFDLEQVTPTNVTNTTATVTHVVKRGETLYGIGKIYDLTPEQIVAANPGTSTGIKAGQVIVIPTSQTSINTDGIIFHTIQSGETLYSVAKKYNTTIEKILELNPGIYPNNFTQGDVIKIVPNVTKNLVIKRDITQFHSYTIKKDDSFESIAQANNITVDELKAANPEMTKCKKGKTLYIPLNVTTNATISTSQATVKDLENTYSGKIDRVYNKVHQINKNSDLNIAIVFPFQLQNENPPRQAYLYTDFYKGFILAVDSINKNNSKKVNINVFDTEHNLNKTDSILALPVMKQMDVIIAPGEPKQLERCNKFGKENNIAVINCFSSKDDAYADNSNVVQLNMPTSYMMAIVNNWIDTKFKDHTVFFLEDAENTDVDIYNEFKNHLTEKGVTFHNLKISTGVDYKTLSQYLEPGGDYLFIPSSGRKAFISKYLQALQDVKSRRFDCTISLIGQPEYLGYKDYKEAFKQIDTYVFSRFFIADENSAMVLNQKFQEKYEEKMIKTTPSFGILGFDLGTFITKAYAENGEINTNSAYFDGIQMDIQLKRTSNWGGLMNDCIELVHFKDGTVSESVIK